MQKQFLFLAIIFILISCGQEQQEQTTEGNPTNAVVDSVAIINDPKNNLNIQTNSFSEIDSSGILMFPLSMGETERDGGSFSYKEMPSNSYWNIVFLNSKTNEYHLLSERKMLINNYDVKYSSNTIDIPQTKNHIFYSITTDDYNKDKKLTQEDPNYLFVTDKNGNNFRQISPSNYHLQNWEFIKSVNKVIMTVKKDSDKNNKFDDNDEVTTFEIDIDKGTEAKEIFLLEFKNKLKILYDRDWKLIKK
ncbi:MAG: hypothetical protein JST29_00010 [Bacteroidetes bacterium]|nr:hypothetical protein [Bacteroidota bacterium]